MTPVSDAYHILHAFTVILSTSCSLDASTCHRMFFANYLRKLPLEQCADNDGHNTDAIDALTLTVPVILHYHAVYSQANPNYDRAPLYAKVHEIIAATRRSKALKSYAENFSNIMIDLLQGGDLRETIEKYAGK